MEVLGEVLRLMQFKEQIKTQDELQNRTVKN
jgi:hypothetical protein